MVMWLMHIVNLKFLYKGYGLKKMSGVIWGQEVKYKGQISNNLKWRNKRCQHVPLGPTCKSVHGDLVTTPMVQGSEVKKGQISNNLNGKTNDANM